VVFLPPGRNARSLIESACRKSPSGTATLVESVFKFARNVIPHLLAVGVLCGILTAGLWPFHAPLNEVSWLSNVHGLRFGEYANVVSTEQFPVAQSAREHSIEIWLESGDLGDTNTILTFYRPGSPMSFALRQNGTGVSVDQDIRTDHAHGRSYILVPNTFAASRAVLITIVAREKETAVYLDGTLAREEPNLILESNGFAGRLLIGDSPFHSDSWAGRLLGLAIYDRALASAEVQRHFRGWTQWGSPDSQGEKHTMALYLFDEKEGDTVHNKVPGRPDLFIDHRYTILDQVFLKPFWEEFNLSSGFWKNVLINIGGFIPLGFVFRAYLSSTIHDRRIAFVVISIGFLTSFTIEVLQGVLPTRQSGTTDLITNTLGTAIGVGLYRWCPSVLCDLLRHPESAPQ
jgi:hypothetical protein